MNDTKSPLISIVTVSYNVGNTIEDTILSVVNQDFIDFEYIIIDGGSKDNTVEIIKKYEDKITFWLSEPDAGIYDAMNKGIKLAAGEWINFMNAGDVFYDTQVFKNVFSTYRFSDVVYGDNMLCYDWGKILLAPDDISNITKHMVFGHQTVFMKKDLLLKYPFDCSFKIAADYNLFYKLYKENFSFEYISKCICLFSANDGVSSNNPRIVFKEYSRINGCDKAKVFRLKLILFTLRLAIRQVVMFFLPTKFIDRKKRKNILKNKLIKEVILNEYFI